MEEQTHYDVERWSFDWNGVLFHGDSILWPALPAVQAAAQAIGSSNLFILSYPGRTDPEGRKAQLRRLHADSELADYIPSENILFSERAVGRSGKAEMAASVGITRHFGDRGDVGAELQAQGIAAELVLGNTRFPANRRVRNHQYVRGAVLAVVSELPEDFRPLIDVQLARRRRRTAEDPQHTMPPPPKSQASSAMSISILRSCCQGQQQKPLAARQSTQTAYQV